MPLLIAFYIYISYKIFPVVVFYYSYLPTSVIYPKEKEFYLIHTFTAQIVTEYYLPNTVVGTENTIISKTDMIPIFVELKDECHEKIKLGN